MSINRGTRDVLLDGEVIRLTRLEFELLTLLADHPYVVLTKEEIGRHVWGYSDGSSHRAIESHFNRIRRKLNGFDPIVTKWGVGYMYMPDGRDGVVPLLEAPQSGSDVVFFLRPDARIFWVSGAFERLLGRTFDDLNDGDFYGQLHPEDRKRVEARHAILESGESVRLAYRVRTGLHEYVSVRAVSEPMLSERDELLSIVTIWQPGD